jgi:hypothetical protein
MSNERLTQLVLDDRANRAIARCHPHDKGQDMNASTLAVTATLAVAASISGCAVDPAIEQRATAFAIGGTSVAPNEVRISNQTAAVETGVVVQRWHASAPGGDYDCSAVQAEQLVAQPVCVKK